MHPRSSQCAQQALLLRTTRGCQKHRRLNLIDPSRSLTTGWHSGTLQWFVLLAVIPTRLPSHADRKAIQLDCHESWRCEGSECCSSPPPQRLISLDTVPGRQRSQSFCWISLNMTQREWFSCTNKSWFDQFTWVRGFVYSLYFILLDSTAVPSNCLLYHGEAFQKNERLPDLQDPTNHSIARLV